MPLESSNFKNLHKDTGSVLHIIQYMLLSPILTQSESICFFCFSSCVGEPFK